jgi:hypothetical protein
MLTPIGNYHHSKLPEPGEIGYLIIGYDSLLHKPKFLKKQRCIVESYPLCDNPQWRGHFYSLGIHTVIVRFLGDNSRKRISGFYFVNEGEL